MAGPNSPIPGWIYKWLILSTFVCVYDGLFCVLRPYSMDDGPVAWLFGGHQYYMTVDAHYADPKDSFIWTQGIGNLIECILNIMVLFNTLKKVQLTKLLCILTSIMLFWKTTLFNFYSLDVPHGFPPPREAWLKLFAVISPSMIWIIVPFYASWVLARDFLDEEIFDDVDGPGEEKDETSPVITKKRYDLRNRR